MGDWKVWATGRIMILLFVLVLALDIGGAGAILAIGMAEAHGQHINILAGP